MMPQSVKAIMFYAERPGKCSAERAAPTSQRPCPFGLNLLIYSRSPSRDGGHLSSLAFSNSVPGSLRLTAPSCLLKNGSARSPILLEANPCVYALDTASNLCHRTGSGQAAFANQLEESETFLNPPLFGPHEPRYILHLPSFTMLVFPPTSVTLHGLFI